jgi:putative membrane protein
MKRVKLIGVLTAVVLSIIVILQNTQPVVTRFLFIKITMPNAILIGLTLLIGIAMGILIALTTSSKRDTIKK